VPTVLFIAYHFPPIGYSGTQRSVKFVRYLPNLGWTPVVLTGPGGGPGGLPSDNTLAAELPTDLRVIRASGSEPLASEGFRSRAERWLGLQTPWARWWESSAFAAGRNAAGDADVLIASMSPFESARVAARLARAEGRPWVADLRDPWALDEMFVYPTILHRRLAERRMRRDLATAAAIVMNTPEAARILVEAFPEFRDRPVVAIPNGYDESDFTGRAAERADSAFRIVHAGSLHTEAGRRERRRQRIRRALGGAIGDVDYLPRSHVYLLEAVRLLRRDRPEIAAQIEVHLAGVLSAADRAETDPAVRIHGYLPHLASVALLQSADMLFLPMHGVREGFRARIVPGKTYEYLPARKPILAAVPSGDAKDIVTAAGLGIVCAPSDARAIARAIVQGFELKEARRPTEANDEVIARYERRRLTAELAELLEHVTREHGSAKS